MRTVNRNFGGYEYGTDIEDAVVVVHEWADIFDIEYEDDSLFLEAKELMSVNTGDVLNWEKVKDDIFNVISYAYVLGNDTERDSMIENAEQLFGEKDIKSIIIKKIRNICEDDFLKKTLDNVFACVYVTVEEGIKTKNLELVNLKCYANIKIMQLLIGAIMYRDKKIYQSLYLILITALLGGNTYKLDKAGFKDKSIDDVVS